MLPQVLSGLSDIAAQYDGLICDVWGVMHNGHVAHPRAIEAIRNFRLNHGPVMMLTNAPRRAIEIVRQFEHYGIPKDCYDQIVTSGEAARTDLTRRSQGGLLNVFHLGPERDRNIFDDLPIALTPLADAQVVLCSGLFDDDVETPEDYAPMLAEMKARGLTFLCANPDFVVQRGGTLIYCAGALARAYEAIGGETVYFGKPYRPVYDLALAAAPRRLQNPLAIGDGLPTDIKGANEMGIDALFIADGIHGEEFGALTSTNIATLCSQSGVTARAAMAALVW